MTTALTTSVEVRRIRVCFGRTLALDDVSLAVPAGAVTAVVGGDGAGKSTLLRVFAGRVRPSEGEVHTLPRAQIGYQPSTSGVWNSLTVQENLSFVGRSYGMTDRAIRTRGDELLGRAGLEAARTRLGSALSGGMRQKLGFLLAILHEPDLVLLDEPSTGVDPVSRVELWRLIAGAAATGTAVLLATTYLDEAERTATVTALDQGRVLAEGVPGAIVADVPGEVGVLLDGGEVPDASWRRGVERHVWLAPGADGARVRRLDEPDLEDALIALTLAARRDDADATRHPRRFARTHARDTAPADAPDAEPDAQEPVIAAPAAATVLASGRHVVKRFARATAVDDVTLEVRSGEIVGLIGANGAGKTTFLRTLLGLERADEGEVALFGRAPDAASRRRLGYVPQGLGLYRTISVDQNVEFFSRVYGVPEVALPASLDAVRREVVGGIGLGRQRQLAFTLALGHDPDLLVLDEPTSGVDPLSRARLWDIIHAEAQAGRGVLVTTHYLQEAEQCTRLALMSQGRLLASGSVDELTAGVSAVLVRSGRWQDAFEALGDAGLAIMLSGQAVRVAGATPDEVRDALGGIPASVDAVAPTLEESMVLLER